jgi:hypothetical protein
MASIWASFSFSVWQAKKSMENKNKAYLNCKKRKKEISLCLRIIIIPSNTLILGKFNGYK